jgi:hypothetical protein
VGKLLHQKTIRLVDVLACLMVVAIGNNSKAKLSDIGDFQMHYYCGD